MANTLGNYNPLFYAQQALMILYKALGMANAVHRDYDRERRTFGKGDTISIRRPGSFTAQNAPNSTPQDITPDTVNIVLDQWKEVVFKLTDKELAFTQQQIIDEHIVPAVYPLADIIDQSLVNLWEQIPWKVDGSDSNGLAVGDIVDARTVLFNNKAPMRDPRFFLMVDGTSEGKLLKASAFSQQQGAGDLGVQTQVSGLLGPKYGFNIFANQNVATQPTQGAVADAAGTITGAHAKGVTSLAVAGLTVSITIKKGTIFTIAGHTQQYVVAADFATDGTGAGTVTLFSNNKGGGAVQLGLAAAVSGGEVITFLIDTTRVKQNLGFHRNFAAIAFAPLSTLGDGKGAQIETITDPFTGLSIRARMWYEGKESALYVGVDVLWGVKLLDSDLAVRLRTAA